MKKNNITLVFVAIVFSIIVGMIIGKSLLKYKEGEHFLQIRKGEPPLHADQIPEDHHIKPFRPVKALLV